MGNKRVGAKGENKGNIKKELCKDLGSGPVRVARWLLDLQSRLIITFYMVLCSLIFKLLPFRSLATYFPGNPSSSPLDSFSQRFSRFALHLAFEVRRILPFLCIFFLRWCSFFFVLSFPFFRFFIFPLRYRTFGVF